MPPLKISVVVPTMNRPDDLRRCLNALKAQNRQADEIIVVIGPEDSSADKIFHQAGKGDPRWKCLNERRSSVVSSLNTGIQAAQGDIIVLTDDDAAAPRDWLGLIEGHFLRNSKVGAVGGKDHLLLPDEPWLSNPPLARIVGTYNWHGQLQGNHHCGSQISPVEVDILKGVNLAFRSDAFLKRQIDNYLIGHGAEEGWEMDLCLTIRRSGWLILYDNDVYVEHHVGPRLAGNSRLDGANPNALRNVQNMAYLNAIYLNVPSMLMVMCRSILLGSRLQPGLLRSLLNCFTRRPGQYDVAWKVIRAYCKGSLDGRRSRSNSNRCLREQFQTSIRPSA
jgi:glycosyltransferase involved in cell wall biosynthesis